MKRTCMAAACVAASVVACVALSSCDFGSGQDGKSAYEIAVDNGFVGSESDWLESLKADSLNINDIYSAAQENGYTGTFLEFLKEYMDGDVTIKEGSTAEFEETSLLSVVSVVCQFTEKTSSGGWGRPASESTVYSLGAGVIYKLTKSAGDAYIITNYHVVYDGDSTAENYICDNINVYLYGQEYSGSSTSSYVPDYSIPATFVGGSMENDIAVLKVEGSSVLKNSNAIQSVFADSNTVSAGDEVYTIGNPSGNGISVCKGIISVESEYITMQSIDESTTVTLREIRVDASVNSGNSGGGLFNADGEVIGIVNAKSVEENVEGMGYALPSTLAKNVADNIIDNCDGTTNIGAKRGTLGVTVYSASSKAVYDSDNDTVCIIEDVTIQSVSSGVAASGKLKSGDIIRSITVRGEKVDVTRRFMVTDDMYRVRKGDIVTISVERGGKLVDVEIEFDKDEYFTNIA